MKGKGSGFESIPYLISLSNHIWLVFVKAELLTSLHPQIPAMVLAITMTFLNIAMLRNVKSLLLNVSRDALQIQMNIQPLFNCHQYARDPFKLDCPSSNRCMLQILESNGMLKPTDILLFSGQTAIGFRGS